MSHDRNFDRREFLKLVCGAGAAAAIPSLYPARASGARTSPGNRIRLGVIGVGAGWPMFVRDDVEYVAVCDVQESRRGLATYFVESKQGSGTLKTYNDFREVLARDDIDAVYIATPDHWHSVITIAAARAGKHVYCQKPLTRTIKEGQAVVDAVNRYGIIFQHGTQQRHDDRMLFGMELVRNGYIGELKHVRLGSPAGSTSPPQPSQPVPAGLDWEMWLGPAPWSPFTPARIQAHPWYHISDYCMGYIAGWGIHHADSAMQGSGLDAYDGPVEVDARGMFPRDGLFDCAYRWQIHYKFSNGLTWHWTDCFGDGFGSRSGPDWPQNRMGITFEGTEGKVFIWRNEVDAEPKSLLRVRIGPNDKVRLRDNLEGDFIECVRQGKKSCAPVEVAQRATNLCSIAAIGMLLGRKVTWDAKREEFIGDDQANRLRSRHMRGEWQV